MSEPNGDRNEAVEAAKRIVATVAESDAMTVARALLSSPSVEREWCLNCGTVTRDHRCHCTEIGQEPSFVNYADELARQMNAAASSTSVEEVRRDAFEEAAKVAEQPYSDDVMALGTDKPFAVGRKIAEAIRSLSPQGG